MKSLTEYIYGAHNIRTNDYLFEDFCLDNDIDTFSLSTDELIETYEDFETYKFMSSTYLNNNSYIDYDEYQHYLYDNIVYENLNQFLNVIKNEYDIKSSEILQDNNKYVCILKVRKNFEYDDDKFTTLCKKYNVFVSNVSKGLTRNRIRIEDIDTPDCSDVIYNKFNGILYHITSKHRVDNILRYGLEPRSENSRFDYPNRIYFISPKTSSEMLNNIKNVLSNDKNVILKINIKQLVHKPKFFLDPSFDEQCNAYWTNESIPPFCITKINNIHIIKDKVISFTHQLFNNIFK